MKVIILIFTHKAVPDAYEVISLKQCFQVLGAHPTRLVCPNGMDPSRYLEIHPKLQVDSLPTTHFNSLKSYNRLKKGALLYDKYGMFEYMLTYELDAFVFRDELHEWCDRGYDFIGAPWFEGFHLASPDSAAIGVGNSGFSLRRVETMRRISHTWRSIRSIQEIWNEWRATNSINIRNIANLLKEWCFRNNFHHLLNYTLLQEDVFWCVSAPRRFKDMRLPTTVEAAAFSFEHNPMKLFRDRNGSLPFGCHKWHSPATSQFWRDHIEAQGYTLPDR